MNRTYQHPAIGPLLQSWELALEGENKATRTVGNYLEGMDLFTRWLEEPENYPGLEVDEVTPAMCRQWLAHLIDTRSASTARTRWAAMRQFWGWAAEEQEIQVNPMEAVKQPQTVEAAIEVLTPEQVRAVLATCNGPSFLERRDQALMMLFVDTGTRASALAGAQLSKVDMRARTIEVVEKGSKVIVKPFGVKAARALDRYLRARARSPYAHVSTAVFISARDGRPLNRNSVLQMLKRRGREAGVPGLHPHMFRHTFVDRWLAAGGSEGDLMELNGWTSRDMLGRYASRTKAERARASHRLLSPGDHLDD